MSNLGVLESKMAILGQPFVPILSFLTPTYSEKQLWPTLTFHRHSVPARSSSWLFNSISLQNLSALFQPLVRFSIFVDFLKYTQILSIFPKYTQITVAAKNPLEGMRVHSVLSVRMQPKSLKTPLEGHMNSICTNFQLYNPNRFREITLDR